MQGSAQCCVTGPAFEHMLQQAEASVVETVMANVTVFARMQSRQKGQVMDLLGRRGLFQNVEGQRRHIAVSEQPSVYSQHVPQALLQPVVASLCRRFTAATSVRITDVLVLVCVADLMPHKDSAKSFFLYD